MLAWLQLALSSPEDQRHPASVEKDASSCGPHSRRASCVIPSPAPDAPLTMGDRMEAAALERRRHGATHRVVLVTMLADDYAHLHNQMMCSLKRLNLSSHMVIATDKRSTCDNLLPEWRAQCFQLDPGLLAAEASYQEDLEGRYRRDRGVLQRRDEFDSQAN